MSFFDSHHLIPVLVPLIYLARPPSSLSCGNGGMEITLLVEDAVNRYTGMALVLLVLALLAVSGCGGGGGGGGGGTTSTTTTQDTWDSATWDNARWAP